MMISPESYVEFHLKGKSKEEVFESIEDLRNEIKELKKALDKKDPEDFMVCPSPGVRYSVSLDYLDAARKYVESQGWEYIPLEEEIKIDKFNERISFINKIEYSFTVFMHGTEKRTICYGGDKILASREFEGTFIHNHKEDWESWYDGMEWRDLLDTILEYRLYDRPTQYENEDVLDGYCWTLKFKFVDGSKDLVFDGMNEFPDSMLDLLDAIGLRGITEEL